MSRTPRTIESVPVADLATLAHNQRMFVIALFLASSLVDAVAAPDFSGRWTADAATVAGGRGDMGSGWGSPITITQDGGKLTVEYAFFARGDMQPALKFVYALDGSTTKNSVMMGRGVQSQSSTAAWNGDSLVITTIHTFTDPGTGRPATEEVKQSLTLESPAVLVVETTLAGALGGPPSTTKTTYRKN